MEMENLSKDDETSEPSSDSKTAEEKLLLSARTGDVKSTSELLNFKEEGEIDLDLNYKGKHKSNHGWTPLHLACYFGHTVIAELLINNGADVNKVNDTGDTPLHKAAYTGREELVLLLLSKNANVFIRNGEGQTARDISKDEDIKKLLKAAEETDLRKKNDHLLHAAREGDVHTIEQLLREDHSPDINCSDSLGNTALHCAAYRGKKEVAVLLLQNGINSSIKNKRGQLAIDLAINPSMKQILGVQPVKELQKNATRFEGLLLRKSRFLGWKQVWTVLEKGVMSFFTSRADSTTGTRRKGYKYLDGAEVILDKSDVAVFIIRFSNNTRQRFSVPYVTYQQVDRQKWVNALTEHIEFSTYYLNQGLVDSDVDEDLDIMPLGTMQDKLQTAQAHQQLFEKQVSALKVTLEGLAKNIENCNNASSPHFHETPWNSIPSQFDLLIESSRKVSSSLSHCLTVFSQQEEVRLLQFKQQQERCRVLQDALHALAQEHHELERSITSPFHSPPRSPLYNETDCDEFFDAFEGDYSPTQVIADESEVQSTKTAVESEAGFFASFSSSATASLSESMRQLPHSKWGRPFLPVPMFSRNAFSVWSILKQCFGKELSKITMPVVFNEPLGFLQRLSENMEYSYLLETADKCDDPVKRMEFVSSFAVAAISSNWERLGKPFNPLLGETYELVREDMGFRIICEQVSHHPPISAFHADSPHFVFSGAIHPKLKLWGRYVEIEPEGTVTLQLLKHNEVYTWTGVTCCVHNIIVGKLWMEQCGDMEITCHSNGLTAKLKFKPAGWSGTDLNCVEGSIYDRQEIKLKSIFGKWCSYLKSADVESYQEFLNLKDQKTQVMTNSTPTTTAYSTPVSVKPASKRRTSTPLNKNDSLQEELLTEDMCSKNNVVNSLDNLESTLLWKADPRPEYSSEYYNFTLFAMALNELQEGMERRIPPTDSRLRPDIRKLEEGDLDNAAFEKNRLEEKQREARKILKRDKGTWDPLWFVSKQHQYAKEDTWCYKGGYWERNFTNCPDIF